MPAQTGFTPEQVEQLVTRVHAEQHEAGIFQD
jgi:hypothetical protein